MGKIDDFPSNRINKEVHKEKPKIEKIVKGKVTTKKKTLGDKFAENFLGDDVKSVKQYLFYDVLIPAAKSTLADLVSGGIDMLLFGETRGKRTYREKGRSYVSYDNFFSSGSKSIFNKEEPERRYSRHVKKYNEVVLETRGEAEEVLSMLFDLTVDYGMASVADLYDMVGIPSSYTDNNYGWTDLRGSTVERLARGQGYVISLPDPKVLK